MTELLKELEAQSKFLRKAAAEIAAAGHAGWGNTCLQAAEALDTHHAEIAEAVKDARRWCHARKILPVEYIEGSQREFESYGLPGSEEENIAADNAIDAAMHNSAREAGE